MNTKPTLFTRQLQSREMANWGRHFSQLSLSFFSYVFEFAQTQPPSGVWTGKKLGPTSPTHENNFSYSFCRREMELILECKTPPASPEPNRLVTKRRCPFGESPQQPKFAALDGPTAFNENFTEDQNTVGELN